MKIYAKELGNHLNNEITFSGFIDRIRDLSNVQFVILRDNTGKVQVTVEKNDNNFKLNEIISNLTEESTVKITGLLQENEYVKAGGMEIIPSAIEVLSFAEAIIPSDFKKKKESNSNLKNENRFLDLRSEKNNLIFKISTILEKSLRDHVIQKDFTEIHSPRLTPKSAESGAEVFNVDYFGYNATLSQSPQFYKQMAMASGMDKVFEIGPAFRAEKSHTKFHAAEINMADVEVSWIDGIQEIENLEEEMLKYAIEQVYIKYGDDIKRVFGTEFVNIDSIAPRMSFQEAKDIIKTKYHYIGPRQDDFDRKEEFLLGKFALEIYKSSLLFVESYPFSARPFYHMLDESGLTKSYDLLFKGVEITTGAQREHRHDILLKQICEKGINPAELEFYINFFKKGCPPHGGFAIGIQRLIMQLLNLNNIAEATFIYREPNTQMKL